MSTDTARPRFTPEPRPPYPRFRFERSVVALVVAVGAVLVAVWSRNVWFYSDVWDFLALRRVTDVESILRPHFGHWQVPAALQTRLLYAISGMEFWPVHYLPRAIAWGGMSVFSWWVMRRRGAHPAAALGAVAVITVFAGSYYFQAAHIGALLAIASAIGAAMIIDARPEPARRDLLAVYALMQLAVMSAGIGVSSLLGMGLGLLIVRRLGRWFWPLFAAGASYAIWFLAFDVLNESAAQAARTPLEVPGAVVVNVRNLLVNITGLPSLLGWPLFVLAVGAGVWLIAKRRLSVFDVVLLASAFVYLILVSRTRANVERGAVATNVALLLAPFIVSHIVLTKRRVVVAVAVLFAALVVSHGIRLEADIDERIATINESRATVESMAALIDRGDAYVPELKLTDLTSSSQLTLAGVDRLVREGWDPGPPVEESSALVRLRVSLFSEPAAWESTIEAVAGKHRRDGCIIAFDGEPVAVSIDGSAQLEIRADMKTSVIVDWIDGDSIGTTTLTKIRRQFREIYVGSPDGLATVWFTPVEPVGKILLCGVEWPGKPDRG